MATRDEDFVTKLFVANTHTPVLFFSSRGIVYKMKVWRLPVAAPQARGRALINLLPLEEGEQITTIMPMPEDEESWASLDVMFATTKGSVRRNKLSDFVGIRQNGKIAMKFEDGVGLAGVDTCTEHDDVLLTTAKGQCIRFSVSDLRVFQSRDSMGVRGIALADDDHVISMAILRHVEATPDERAEYLKRSRAIRGETEEVALDEEAVGGELSQERYAEMSAAEQFILTISENGYGKRTSSYEYRISGRGGKGIIAMTVSERNGEIIASFPVEESDQIMLVTNGGQLIRVPIDGIRIAGRSTQGVIVFSTGEDEKVVSVERISEDEEDDAENGNDEQGEGETGAA